MDVIAAVELFDFEPSVSAPGRYRPGTAFCDFWTFRA
jgi:hypothetical protein